ncbi:cytochrome P450 [Luteococcus peritonei]|uniref:Cytochrome P450 n=1 Tax=Luteococcus peritonei TaxID=88874 RepID=A0ABW4RTA0_9ACTN
MSSCPVDRRKTNYPGESRAHGIELVDGTWQVRSMEAVRQVLRSRATTQAGFNAESVTMRGLRKPILFADGEGHRSQRSAIARYFAPKTVDSRYHGVMERSADELVAGLVQRGEVDLSQLSLHYSVVVAGEVVGLTSSDTAAMARRLERFFDIPVVPADAKGTASRFDTIAMATRSHATMAAFFLKDVRPAIRARRNPAPGTERPADVISHLVDAGYKDPEILIECITYGAAGMVTTREYISMATWHLLGDEPLRRRYLAADKAERYTILHEILRLEPIVGHLYRRTTEPVEVELDGTTHHIPAGALLDLFIRNANTDPEVVGEAAYDLCPGRELPPRVGEEVMSFGDGPHKCPGNALAIQEADVLLTRLLALPVRLTTTPVLGWDELIRGYSVRSIHLALDREEAPAGSPG